MSRIVHSAESIIIYCIIWNEHLGSMQMSEQLGMRENKWKASGIRILGVTASPFSIWENSPDSFIFDLAHLRRKQWDPFFNLTIERRHARHGIKKNEKVINERGPGGSIVCKEADARLDEIEMDLTH